VPISLTVFTQEQLSNRNIYNAADLGACSPSLSVNQRYGPEKSSFAIRGFTQEMNTSPSVGVYFASVLAPRVQGNATAGNGAGGAILLVPQNPTDKLEGYVEGSAGDFGMVRGLRLLSVPLADMPRLGRSSMLTRAMLWRRPRLSKPTAEVP
jgi:iron complex outermembrane receptor protein